MTDKDYEAIKAENALLKISLDFQNDSYVRLFEDSRRIQEILSEAREIIYLSSTCGENECEECREDQREWLEKNGKR